MPSPLIFTIGGSNLSAKVQVRSFQIDQVLTRRGDSAKITLVDVGNTVTVARFATVTVTDNSSNTLFKGWVTKQRQRPIGATERLIDLTCQDATIFLTGRHVNKKYTNAFTTDIAKDLLATASPTTGITSTNTPAASGPLITFSSSHVALSTELTRLAKLASQSLATVGGGIYDWYVDNTPDLHFFVASSAPVSTVVLTDAKPVGNQLNYNRDTFYYEIDDTQLGNSVLVRGAQIISLAVTDSFTGDGVTTSFALSQAPDIPLGGLPVVFLGGVSQTVAQATGTTATTQWVVSQDATSLIWSLSVGTAAAPGGGFILTATYVYDVPAFSQQQNTTDIAALSTLPNTGQFDRIIQDSGVLSQIAAISRANAELAAYGQSYKNIQVATQLVTTGAIIGGISAGQQIQVINAQLGINVTMLIIKLSVKSAPGGMAYYYDLTLQGLA